MAIISHIKINNAENPIASNNMLYGVCSTAAATAAKTVTISNSKFTLQTGATIVVKFTITNTAANPTLNVDGTGAKAIYYNGAAITAGYLKANKVYEFIYNGTQWDLIGDVDTNTTYTSLPANGGNADTVDNKHASDFATSTQGTKADNALPKSGGNVTGHIYLTGAKETSSTSNTSQIVFGTSSSNHVAISSNDNALVINPTTATTTNQIVLYLDKASLFPSGISANLTGTASKATADASGNNIVNTYATKTELSGKANTSHTHTKSEITNFPSSLKNPNALTIQGNGTTLTNGTYDGSVAKTVNITASAIGAAASSHNHAASNIISGTLNSARLPIIPITKGGTGAITAAAALTKLGAAPAYTYGTEDLVPGESPLETGKLHFVYE